MLQPQLSAPPQPRGHCEQDLLMTTAQPSGCPTDTEGCREVLLLLSPTRTTHSLAGGGGGGKGGRGEGEEGKIKQKRGKKEISTMD